MKIDVNVPDGELGNYAVETYTLTEEDLSLFNMRALFKPGGRTIEPGTYKRLVRTSSPVGIGSRVVLMSNTQAEIDDQHNFIWRAKQAKTVLINGLGLGVALTEILKSDTICSVTVIEISPEVIALVGPTFTGDSRVTIVYGDAFLYKPPRGTKYDVVWHDVWDYICEDNLDDMKKLHRKYGHRCKWQGSWARELCRG